VLCYFIGGYEREGGWFNQVYLNLRPNTPFIINKPLK
jgi:hypothetical protein